MKRAFITFIIFCILVGMIYANGLNSSIPSCHSTDTGRFWGLAETNFEVWDSNSWVQDRKSIVSYDTSGRPDSLYRYEWNANNNAWENQSVIIFTYATDQELVTSTETRLWEVNHYIPDWRYQAVYDNHYRLTELFGYTYDSQIADWVCSSSRHYVYGAGTSFQVNSWVWYDIMMPGSVTFFKSDIQFDTQGRIISENWQTSLDSLLWFNSDQNTYYYHPDDNTTGEDVISYIAHMVLNQYFDDELYFYGMINEFVMQIWNNDDWLNISSKSGVYDADNRLSVLLFRYWQTADNDWIPDEKYIYSYAANGNLQSKVVMEYHNEDSSWYDKARYLYMWTQITENDDNNAPQLNGLTLSLYPNPFNDKLTLAAKSKSNEDLSYQIYNLKGQKVCSLTSARNEVVTWDGKDNFGRALGDGVYFIRATQGNNQTTRKFLKLK